MRDLPSTTVNESDDAGAGVCKTQSIINRRAIGFAVATCIGGRLAIEFLVLMTATIALARRGIPQDDWIAELTSSTVLHFFLAGACIWSSVLGGRVAQRLSCAGSTSTRFVESGLCSALIAGAIVATIWLTSALLFMDDGPVPLQLAGVALVIPAACMGAYGAGPSASR